MNIIISLLAIYGITFFIKEKDGPFDVMTIIRSKLMKNQYVGVFFYKLLDCYFCVGTYAGIIVYVISKHFQGLDMYEAMLWGFAGAATSMIINMWASKNE